MNTVQLKPALGNLSRSLTELWEVAESQHHDEGLTRALTQTMILVTDSEHAAEMHDMLDGLLSRHPCRAVFIVMHEQPTEPGAELVGKIRNQGRTHAMVLEKLTIHAHWSDYRKLPNLIRPLLVNDIPTSLFWAMQLPDSLGKIAALASMAERTLVDSALFAGDDWRGLRQLNEHHPIDLAWLRVAPWRRALAEAFEHFEWAPVEPETSVVIEHGATYGSIGAARCLEHWLVGKLGAIVTLQQVADVSTVGDANTMPTTDPRHLSLRHGPVHVTLEHLGTEPRIRINVTLNDHCLMPTFVMASRGTRCNLLAAALDSRVSMSCR